MNFLSYYRFHTYSISRKNFVSVYMVLIHNYFVLKIIVLSFKICIEKTIFYDSVVGVLDFSNKIVIRLHKIKILNQKFLHFHHFCNEFMSLK